VVLPAATERYALDRPVPFPDPVADGPRASVIVVTHDGLAFTRLCLESVLEHTEGPYELIVVDNGSSDGTRSYLHTLARRAAHVRFVGNVENRGFPAACNQGLAWARAERVVLLNNDCVVAPGWLDELLAPLADPAVGIVGATTNRIGNEAEVPVDYTTFGGLLGFAGRVRAERAGVTSPLPTPAMFCAAFTRATVELLGALDEGFGIGTLEDDDYAMRARQAGLRNVCAEAAFVHHFGEASFGKLVASGEYGRVLERNRERFAERWGVEWSAYGRRRNHAYELLREHVQAVVENVVPEGAEAAVVSRGDDELIRFVRRRGTHFPRDPAGCYAGSYPAPSAEAVAHLEELRRAGARYFVVPEPGFWWLEHYGELRERLADGAPEVHRDDACVIFELTGALA
jgi:GT2 family glycosyltransferase